MKKSDTTWTAAKFKKWPGVYYRFSKKIQTWEYAYKQNNNVIKLKAIGEDQVEQAFKELTEIRLYKSRPDLRAKTFYEEAIELIEEKKSTKIKSWIGTESNVRLHLKELHHIKLSEITEELITNFTTRVKNGDRAQSTTNKILLTLKEVLERAKKHRHINRDVSIGIKIPEAKNEKNIFLSKTTVMKVLAKLRKRSHQTYTIALIGATTGLRYGDITQLKKEDLKKDQTIFCKGTKGGKSRHVYIIDKAYEEILNYQEKAENGEYIFKNKKGQKLIEVNKTFERVMNEVYNINKNKEDRATFHSLRHTFAKAAIEAGMSIKDLQQQLGHQDIKMTLRYISVDDTLRFKAVQNMFNK